MADISDFCPGDPRFSLPQTVAPVQKFHPPGGGPLETFRVTRHVTFRENQYFRALSVGFFDRWLLGIDRLQIANVPGASPPWVGGSKIFATRFEAFRDTF